MKADLKHPANRNPPVGCHSAAGKHLKEVVIYENSQAYPLARVKFRLKLGTLIPDPYAKDSEAHRYLKSLHQVPTGMGRFSDIHGPSRLLDDTEVIVNTNARLIMGWSSSNSATTSEMSNDGFLDRIGELEMRVAELERENAALRELVEVAGNKTCSSYSCH